MSLKLGFLRSKTREGRFLQLAWLRPVLWGLGVWSLSLVFSGAFGGLWAFDGVFSSPGLSGSVSGGAAMADHLGPCGDDGEVMGRVEGTCGSQGLSRAELNKLKKVLEKGKEKDKNKDKKPILFKKK
ncbi:hypothetical protein TheveDRAFT_1767 [Thermanaerovibrio velox DSM 12556]|uniref:Uncharacterized protein n=1 Tax=Thermanaerovibrio velox DSM 12556 TaxID=926567 RepID=H0UR48_9BACT|nr:hypothetical protein [Thermanaerovibrio velox]EHM10885.1 hypothetical protein TheveDRAFT_1767 [Thermanaerovibrio velox DSM 12556]